MNESKYKAKVQRILEMTEALDALAG